ncbi:MAG: YfcC family protein [Oscillospiraceae bacterium]
MKNKKIEMPSAFTILLVITAAVAVLTWIIPASKYVKIEAGEESALVHVPLDRDRLYSIEMAGDAIETMRTDYAQELTEIVQSENPELSQKLKEAVPSAMLYYLETGDSRVAKSSMNIPAKQGIWSVISAPIEGFFGAKDVALFILVIGGFVGIVMKTGALDATIGSLIKKMRGKEILLIPMLMVIFAIGGTTYGMCEETIAFYPIIIPVFLAAGFDLMTGFAVILIAAGVGVLASTTNPFATGVASGVVGLGLGDGMILRFIMWVVLVGISIAYVMLYAKKVKANPSLSIVKDVAIPESMHKDTSQEVEFTGRRKLVMALFALTFVVMILGVIPWDFKFNIPIFTNIYNGTAKLSRIFGLHPTTAASYWANYDMIPTYSAALGDWYFGQLSVWFLVMSVIIGIAAGMGEKELIKTFMTGVRDLVSVALIVGLSRGIKVVMEFGGMDSTILRAGELALKNTSPVLFTSLAYIFNIPLAFLIPSTSGLANATMPIVGGLAGSVFSGAGLGAAHGQALAITAYQSASGLVNLISPTSGAVMGALALAGIGYGQLIKFMAKLLGILFLATIILLSVGVFLPI